MINESVTEAVLNLLNEAVALDRYALHDLLAHRVPCATPLADHPSIQVMGHGEAWPIPPGQFRVGVLGILNGICGTYDDDPKKGWGPITAVYQDGLLHEFVRTRNQEEA